MRREEGVTISLTTWRSGATAIAEANALQLPTDIVTTQGIVDISGTQFLVTANTNLTVSVAAGRAYLSASGGDTFPIINSGSITVTINPNASGNPRITSLVLYTNPSGSPAADGSGTTSVIAVDGTPAASPSAPSGATIQSAVGSGNPYTVLANITVHSGDSNLATQGILVDTRVKVVFLGQGQSGWTPASDTWVYVSSNSFKITGVDRTGIFKKGTRVQWNDGSTKYGVVASCSFSTDTTVTLFANTDYTVANAAITQPFYSYILDPVGYPTWFNVTSSGLTFGAGGSMTFTGVTVNLYKFCVEGQKVTVVFDVSGTTGGTASNVVTVSLPVTPDITSNNYRGGAQVADNADIAGQYFLSGVANIERYDSGLFTLSGSRVVRATIIYGF